MCRFKLGQILSWFTFYCCISVAVWCVVVWCVVVGSGWVINTTLRFHARYDNNDTELEVGWGGHLGSHEVRTGVKGGNTFLPSP